MRVLPIAIRVPLRMGSSSHGGERKGQLGPGETVPMSGLPPEGYPEGSRRVWTPHLWPWTFAFSNFLDCRVGLSWVISRMALFLMSLSLVRYCDAPFPGGPLTTRQPAEYKWILGYPTPLQKIGQSLLYTGSSTQIQHLHETCPKQSNIIT